MMTSLSSSPPPPLLPPQVPIRIAVLETDHVLPQTRANYGGYTGLYTLLLHTGADLLGLPRDKLQLSKWDVVQRGPELSEQEVEKIDYPKLDDIDAILISGSKFSASESPPWINRLIAYTKSVLAQNRVRIIGVCFGHQIVGRALGSTVIRSPYGFEISVSKVDLTETGKSLFDGKDILHIMQMRRDTVVSCPSGVKPLGSSPMCENQGMYVQRRLFTLQAHPEFKHDIVKEIIEVRKEQKILDESLAADGLRRVMDRHDGHIVGKAFVRFLIE